MNHATSGEVLSDMCVELIDEDGAVVDSALTDANGLHDFSNLDPGTYGLRFADHRSDGRLCASQPVGDERRVLRNGDAYRFNGRIPHRLRVIGDQPVVSVSCTTPPVF